MLAADKRPCRFAARNTQSLLQVLCRPGAAVLQEGDSVIAFLPIAAGVVHVVLGGGSSMTIHLIGGSEPAAVIVLWFHCATMLLSFFPLVAGVPNTPVRLSGVNGSLMLGVAGSSFVAQLLSTRGLQRCQAAKAAAMGFTQVVYSHIMGAVFFDDKLTLGGLLGTLLILAGALLVTLRLPAGSSSGSKAGGAAVCADTAAAGSKLADSGTISDKDAAALLAGDNVPSHLSAADKVGREDAVAAVAVVTLRADSDLSAKPRAASPAGEAEQLSSCCNRRHGLSCRAGRFRGADGQLAGPDSCECCGCPWWRALPSRVSNIRPGSVPPGVTAAGSIHCSVTAGISVPRGLPFCVPDCTCILGLSTRAWDLQGLQLQQPATLQAQLPAEPVSGQEGQRRRSSRPAPLEPAAAAAEAQATCVSPGLRQALLLQGEHSSPGRRSSALLEQEQERAAAPPL